MAVTVRIVPIPEPIKVTIGPKTPPPVITLELDIRKSLNGDLMIFDHGDIDIVLSGKDKKITAFPKQMMTDFTYGILLAKVLSLLSLFKVARSTVQWKQIYKKQQTAN